MCSFICSVCSICGKEFHKSASKGSEDGILCSGLQDLCTLSIASFSEESTELQDFGFVSIRMREVGEASAELVSTEGTVLSYRMLGSFIRQQVH